MLGSGLLVGGLRLDGLGALVVGVEVLDVGDGALDKAKIVDADGNAIDLDDIVPESERPGDVEELDDDAVEAAESDAETTEAPEAETAETDKA